MSSPLSSDAFAARRMGLEAEYFHKKDADLVGKLKTVFSRKLEREALRKATGIQSTEVLDRLLAVNAKGELLLAFRLYPLVDIAWADKSVDTREVKAVVEAAMKLGVPPKSEALAAIEAWLTRGPTEDGRLAWYMFANELRKTLSPDELDKFREELLTGTKAVASASGGLLGAAFQVSPNEQRVLDQVAKALTHD
jgi:Tellurite resistance protein TerB